MTAARAQPDNSEIDMDVYHDLNNQGWAMSSGNAAVTASPSKQIQSYADENNVITPPSDYINTMIGKIPKSALQDIWSPQNIKGYINSAILPPFDTVGAAKNAIEYLHPERAAEAFRNELINPKIPGQETPNDVTTNQNIDILGKRAQLARNSSEALALIPKNEFYSQVGNQSITGINPSQLPEGNLGAIAKTAAPGEEISDQQAGYLSNALEKYRERSAQEPLEPTVDKNGKEIYPQAFPSFMNRLQDIFGNEIPEHAESKIEDMLAVPTKRDSEYLSRPNVDENYNEGLQEAHDKYVQNDTANNYDTLQSALGKEIRRMQSKNLDTPGEKILAQLQGNRNALLNDKQNFTNTLPQDLQNKENEFRQQWRENVIPHSYAGAVGTDQSVNMPISNTVDILSSGQGLRPSATQVGNAYSSELPNVQTVLRQMGSAAKGNILYNALQSVKPGDVEGMANKILDLRRTKGYEQFVPDEMVTWANNLLKQNRNAEYIKHALGSLGGGAMGGLVGGPLGALAGASLPFAKEGAKYLASKVIK